MLRYKFVKNKRHPPIRLIRSAAGNGRFALIFWISDYRRTADVVVMLYAGLSFEFDAIGEAALLSDENPDTQNDIDLEKKKIYDNFVSEYDYNKWLRDFVDQIEDLETKK